MRFPGYRKAAHTLPLSTPFPMPQSWHPKPEMGDSRLLPRAENRLPRREQPDREAPIWLRESVCLEESGVCQTPQQLCPKKVQ